MIGAPRVVRSRSRCRGRNKSRCGSRSRSRSKTDGPGIDFFGNVLQRL